MSFSFFCMLVGSILGVIFVDYSRFFLWFFECFRDFVLEVVLLCVGEEVVKVKRVLGSLFFFDVGI